jgi:5'-AMP-activated protein kinase regulatory gamma subunit
VLDGEAANHESAEGDGVQVLCHATLSGVVACLMRHFKASLASLPLLAEPVSSLPLGTWSPDSKVERKGALSGSSGVERKDRRKIAPIQAVTKDLLLTDAMGMLLEFGVSSLPVLDAKGAVIDIFARADVTSLAKGNAYSRLQFEDVTVGQALSLADAAAKPPQVLPLGGTSPSSSLSSLQDTPSGAQSPQRLWTCSPEEPLRGVLERLALPRVRRVVVVHPETRCIECIVSLSDIAAFLLLT